MPNFYAHYVHGQNVFAILPQTIREKITHKDAFDIGLQGPDIFYPYRAGQLTNSHRVNMLGSAMHYSPCSDFLAKFFANTEVSLPSCLFSYLSGFVCHFALDTVCHPYINAVAEKGNFSHGEIEVEFDRAIMILQGVNPLETKIADMIKISSEECVSIAEAYKGFKIITPAVIRHSIKDFKFVKEFFFSPSQIKQQLLKVACTTLQINKLYNSCVMRTRINPESFITNSALVWLLNDCIGYAKKLIVNVYEHISGGTELSKEFDRKFV